MTDSGQRLGRLYDPMRTHRQLAGDAAERFDAAVYDAHEAEGKTFQAIAREAGCSTSAAHRAFVREAERRQRVHIED